MITLNPVASLLWPQLDPRASADGLVEILRDAFKEVSAEQLRQDVDAFLEELLSEGLIEVAEPA